MPLTEIPAVGASGSLGPVKSDLRPVKNAATEHSASEHNAAMKALAEVCEEVGLGDGTTPGSLVARATSLEGRTGDLEAVAGLGPVVAEEHGLSGGAAFGVDPNGVASALAKPDGSTWMKPSRETRKSLLRHGTDEELALALGARGTVCLAGGNAAESLVTYMGTAEGPLLPYVARTNALVESAHILHTSEALEIHVGYGQSWRTNEHDPAEIAYQSAQALADYLAVLAAPQLDAFMTLGLPGSPEQLPIRASIAGSYVSVHDLIAVGDAPDTNRAGIDRGAALAFGRLRTRDHTHRVPMTHLLAGWPGVTWDSLKPGAAPVDTTAVNAWDHMIAQCAKVAEVAAYYGKAVLFRAVGWTHGGTEVTPGDYLADLGEMTAAFDAEELNGPGGANLHFFIDQNAADVAITVQRAGALDQVEFCRTNANGRSWMVGPRYPYAFRDVIHHTALGQLQYGELEALAKHYVLDLAGTWTPLWVTNVSIVGAVITVTTSDPFGGDLVLDTTQIEAAQDDGWTCWDVVGAAFLSIASVAYAGTTVTITLSATPAGGTVIEVGYAYRGRDGTQAAGTPSVPSHSPCWGNVKMVGPASTLFSGKTIDAWLCIHAEEVTA